MVAAVLLALLTQQPSPAATPQVSASLDRDRLRVGEELTLTVRAVSGSDAPLRITMPAVGNDGLAVVGRSERSEVSLGAKASRTTTLEVRLRALRQGRWELGPFEVTQKGIVTRAPAAVVQVTESAAATAPELGPRLRAILSRAPPPERPGEVAVSVVLSSDSVRVGEQVDMLTLAWFPRDLRQRLRRAPLLQPPVMDGTWTYPQAVPLTAAASRRVGGVWYDLFVAHQIIFPLVPGRLSTPGATLRYSVPVALQFFSQEERFTLRSGPASLAVAPLPAAGRPASFGGAVGRDLTLERRIDPGPVRAGAATGVELVVRGEGNLALWPSPEIQWPAGVRAYPDRTEEQLESAGGRVGGRKIFRFLVVADSAGSVALPAVEYAYFDLGANAYRIPRVDATTLGVLAAGEGVAARVDLPLLSGDRPAWPRRIARSLPDWAWALLLVLPVLPWVLRRHRPRRRRAVAEPSVAATSLAAAEADFDRALRSLVPDAATRAGPELGAALRAAGVTPAVAQRTLVLRDRLLAARYGPDADRVAADTLAGEVHRLAGELAVRESAARRRARAVLAGAVLLAAVPARAQAPAAEQLYRSGALRAAVEAFARRATDEPAVAAHWYNLGVADYRLGEDGRAAAALVTARRLAPRDAAVRRAARLVPPPDPASARRLWVSPVTPDELLLAGAVLWLLGWIGLLFARRARRRWEGIIVGAALALAVGAGLRAWYADPLALVVGGDGLRVSPYGRAHVVAPLETGTAVRLVRRQPGWVLVRAMSGAEGWMPAEALAPVRD